MKEKKIWEKEFKKNNSTCDMISPGNYGILEIDRHEQR